jgi:hypothetical protein
MWDDLVRHAPTFQSAVLTGLDGDGYPVSLRCQPQIDAPARLLRVVLSAHTLLHPGPASLLCHRHDEHLWNQKSFLVRGVLSHDGAAWTFRPRHFVPGIGIGGPLALIRFVIDSRRRTRQYLRTRGLARPTIPWAAINAVKEHARRQP